MKKILGFIVLFLLFKNANSQIAYYDAVQIRNNYITVAGTSFTFKGDPSSMTAICKILKNYLPDVHRNNLALTESQVLQLYTSNKFLQNQANTLVGGASATTVGPASVLAAAGDLDVTNLADGLAKFLVERTKEELNAAFFENFKKKINEPGYEDALILFPQTCATLNAIGSQIYNYQAYISALRESFEGDINGLLSNLPKIINDARHTFFFNANPKLKSICLSAIYIGNGLLSKEQPGKIIADFDNSYFDAWNVTGNNTNDIKESFRTFQLFSESLRSKGTDHYWIDKDSLNIMLNDPITLQIYFGLLYQQAGAKGIVFSTGTFQSILSANLLGIANINKANSYLKEFIKYTEILKQRIKNVSVADKDKLTFQDYYNFYSSALDVVEYAGAINKFPGLNGLNLGSDFASFIKIARAGGNTALDINRKNYSSAIINVYQIYDYAFVATNTKFKSFLLKYGSFVASVSQAQNSDEVKKAIEAAVLPSGSSRIKRETPFNVSINSYVGLFLGKENINGVQNDNRLANSYGLTAPVGVSISRGHSFLFLGTGKKGWADNKYGWSSSLFISLIDLGAVAAYRFEDSETDQVPTIQLKHIFSPGLFISTGIPKSPLSFNFGAQVGPALRKINTEITHSADISNKTYIRYSISLCVDIPLLNLYTKN